MTFYLHTTLYLGKAPNFGAKKCARMLKTNELLSFQVMCLLMLYFQGSITNVR